MYRLLDSLRRIGTYALCALVVLALTGCFTHDTVVRVASDGSGTVEQTVILHGPMLQMMQSFSPSGEEMELYTREELEQTAREMGDGVRLASVDSVTTSTGGRGYTAGYAFDDINTLNINQSPADEVSPPSGDDTSMPDANLKDIRFDFTPGAPAQLTIHMPPMEPDTSAQEAASDSLMAMEADSAQQAMQMAMMKEMMKGGGVSLTVVVDGTIQETNASYRDDNRITLLSFDFDALIEDEDRLRSLSRERPDDLAEAQALLQDVEGLSAELNETVTVRFE